MPIPPRDDLSTEEKSNTETWARDLAYSKCSTEDSIRNFTRKDIKPDPIAGMSEEFSKWKPGDIVDIRFRAGISYEGGKVLGFHEKYSDTVYVETKKGLLVEVSEGYVNITEHPSWTRDERLYIEFLAVILYKKDMQESPLGDLFKGWKVGDHLDVIKEGIYNEFEQTPEKKLVKNGRILGFSKPEGECMYMWLMISALFLLH